MVTLNPHTKVHFLGIGGIGVSAVARLLLERGLPVHGSDVKESSITRALRAEGATVTIGHGAANLAWEPDLVVFSTAIPQDNIEKLAALERGIPVIHRSEILAMLMAEQTSIGVTGTHGKGTVSAMVTRILDAAGREPGFTIGGMLLDYQTNARHGAGTWLVAEVDESDGSQLRTRPDYLVVNYVELDHLNYYSDLDDIVSATERYITANSNLKALCLNVGCEGVRQVAEGLRIPYIGYSADPNVPARWTLSDMVAKPRSIRFTVNREGQPLGSIELPIPGEHNAQNALAATALCCDALDIPFSATVEGLGHFHGLENRFTIVDADGVTVVKDYLSHPTGMRKILKAARRLDAGRLVAVYKPYRFTLLRYLGEDYAESFDAADHVVLTNVYSAGEAPIDGIDDNYLVDRCRQRGQDVTHVDDTEDIPKFLDGFVKPGDVVVLFGGDDFFRMADAWTARRQG